MTQSQKCGTTATASPLSGNRLIPIGGRHLHCEPPAEFWQERTGREEWRGEERKDALCNCACGSVLSSNNYAIITECVLLLKLVHSVEHYD